MEFVYDTFIEREGELDFKLIIVGECVRTPTDLDDGLPTIGSWSEYRRESNRVGLCLPFNVGLIGGFEER